MPGKGHRPPVGAGRSPPPTEAMALTQPDELMNESVEGGGHNQFELRSIVTGFVVGEQNDEVVVDIEVQRRLRAGC